MFGRGRGRGGRGPPPGAVLRDDEGNVLAAAAPGPPPLFPAGVPLPPLPSVSDAERALLERKRLLERAWRASPYFLPLPSAKKAADDDGVERYSDRYKPSAVPGRAPLSAFLTLDSRYFPAELHRRRAASGGRGAGRGRAAPWLAAEGAAGGDMLRLERLAEAERRAAERGAADAAAPPDDDDDAIRAPTGASKRPRRVAAGGDDEDDDAAPEAGAPAGEGGDVDADEEAAEEDDDVDDEEDYGGAAGGAFDDDEDFGDDLGGGGDDDGGATY